MAMREFIRDVVYSVFILPFTAGHLRANDVNNESHDGTVTGPVLFTTILAILCQVLILGTSEMGEHVTSIDVLSSLMTALASLAILSCIGISIYSHVRPDINRDTHNWNISIALEIRFYWLFSLACMSFNIIKLCYHVECFHKTHQYVYIPEAIAFDIVFLLLYLFQTGFFTRYLHFEFVHHIGVYYGLMILAVTNLSIFVREFAILYHDPLSHVGINDTSIPAVIRICQNTSTTFKMFSNSKPFLHPAIFEYSLLTMVFLAKVWPKDDRSRQEGNNSVNSEYDNIYDSIEYENSSESTRLLHNQHDTQQSSFAIISVNTTAQSDINRRTRKFISIAFGVLLNIPAVILHILKMIDQKSEVAKIVSTSYNLFHQFIMLFLNIRCFYMMRRQCNLRREYATCTPSKYLILVSSWGLMSFYTVELYSRVLGNTDGYMSISNIVLDISRILSTYLQTVFLLQMRYYQKTSDSESWTSIEFLCLFMSVENLGLWAVNTFVDSQNVFKNDTPFQFYGADSWDHLVRFWYPFIIFYRFKSFVMFYSYFHMLK